MARLAASAASAYSYRVRAGTAISPQERRPPPWGFLSDRCDELEMGAVLETEQRHLGSAVSVFTAVFDVESDLTEGVDYPFVVAPSEGDVVES